MNHHDTVLPGLGQALGGGAGHAADLVAVLVLGLTGGAGGSFLLDAVQQGQELGIDINLLVGEGSCVIDRAFRRSSWSGSVDQAVFAGGLLVASGIGVNHLLAADRLGSLPCRRSGHIGKPDLADVIAVPGVELEGDLLGLAGSGVGVSFVRRAAVLHLGVDYSEVRVGSIVAIFVGLLRSHLILNVGLPIIDVDHSGALGIPVDGRGIRQRNGLGGGLRLHIDLAAFGIHKSSSGPDVSLVIVGHKGNRHGADQLSLVLGGAAGGAHVAAALAGGAGLGPEGGLYLCRSRGHDEDVASIVIRPDLLGKHPLGCAGAQGLLNGQLVQLIAVRRVNLHQDLLAILGKAGVGGHSAGGHTADLLHRSGGDAECVRSRLGGIGGCHEGVGGAAVGGLHSSLDAGAAVDGPGAQRQCRFTGVQLPEQDHQLHGYVGHHKGEVCGGGTTGTGFRNHHNGLVGSGGLIGVADHSGVDGVAAVGNRPHGNGVALVGFHGSGDGAVLGGRHVDLQLSALDFIHTLTHQVCQFCHPNIAENRGIGVIFNHVQQSGQDSGNGVQAHGLLLAVGALHGSLGPGGGLFRGGAGDVHVTACGELGTFQNQGLAVLEDNGHSEESAEAVAAGGLGRDHDGAGVAGSDLHIGLLLGSVLLGDGGHVGNRLRRDIDIAAGVDGSRRLADGIDIDKAERQGQGDDADGCDRGGADVDLAHQIRVAAGSNAAAGCQIGVGLCVYDHHRERQTEPLENFIVCRHPDIGGGLGADLSAGVEGAVDGDVRSAELNSQGELDVHQTSHVHAEDGLGLDAGGGEQDAAHGSEDGVLGHFHKSLRGEVKVPEVQLHSGQALVQVRGADGAGDAAFPMLIRIGSVNGNVIGSNVLIQLDLLAPDFQIQAGEVNLTQAQFLSGDHKLGEINLLVLGSLHGQGSGLDQLQGLLRQHVVGEGVGNGNGAALNLLFGDFLLGLVGNAVRQGVKSVGKDFDGPLGAVGNLDGVILVSSGIIALTDRLGSLGVNLAAELQDVIAILAVQGNGLRRVGGGQIDVHIVRAAAQIHFHSGAAAAGFFPGDGNVVTASTGADPDCGLLFCLVGIGSFQPEGNLVVAVPGFHRHVSRTPMGAGDGIVAVSGPDLGVPRAGLGEGHGVVLLGAVDGDAGFVPCLHHAVHGQVKSGHDDFKVLRCVDINISVDQGIPLALFAYGGLIDDFPVFRFLVGVLRQNIQLEPVRQVFAGGVDLDVPVIHTRRHGDGDVLAVLGSGLQSLGNGLVNGVVGHRLSAPDIGIIGAVVGGAVVVFLQSAEGRVLQFFLNFLRRGHRLPGVLAHDVVGNGDTIGLDLVQIRSRKSAAGSAAFRQKILLAHTGIVINLRLNHGGIFVGESQGSVLLPGFQQIFQLVGLLLLAGRLSFARLRHHILNDGGPASLGSQRLLNNVAGFGRFGLLRFFCPGNCGQKSAKQTEAKQNYHNFGNSLSQSVPI